MIAECQSNEKEKKNTNFLIDHNLSTTWHYSDLGITLELKKKSKHYTKIFWMEKKNLNEHYALKNNDGFSLLLLHVH